MTNANSAFALASCRACTTVAVSFQVVLIVGQTDVIAPINVAGALNANCPACITTAIADQIVASLDTEPSEELLARIRDSLERLDAIDPASSPQEIATQVLAVHQQVKQALQDSGQLASEDVAQDGAPASTTPAPPPEGSSTTPEQAPASTTGEEPPPATTTPSETTTTPAQTTPTTTSAEPAPAPAEQPATAPTTTTTTSTTPTTTTTTP